MRLSIRLPPTLSGEEAVGKLKQILTENPPYGAEVTILKAHGASGWNAPPSEKWFEDIIEKSSQVK